MQHFPARNVIGVITRITSFHDSRVVFIRPHACNMQPETESKHGKTEPNLFEICRQGDFDALAKYKNNVSHDKLVEAVNEVDMESEEMTPLMYAAAAGFTKLVEKLIQCGAELDSQSQYGMTACHFACAGDHSSCVEVLVRHGADVMLRAFRDLPISIALRNGYQTCVDVLLRAGNYASVTTLYHDAVESGNVAMCEKLLEHEYPHIDGIRNSSSPLHAAASGGLTKIVEFFITHGAELELRDSNGRTPLLCAITTGSVTTVKLLIDRGSNVNAVDNTYSQLSAVHVAAQLGYMDCLAELISAGACLDICDNRGLTPLMRTVASSDTQPAILLICENACLFKTTQRHSFNDRLRQFITVVDIAVLSKMYKMAELLLECGAHFSDQLFDFPVLEARPGDCDPLRRCLALKQVDDSREMRKFIQWYINFKSNPISLRHNCRLAIRRSLKCPLSPKLHQLQLPSALKKYLYLDDLKSEKFGENSSGATSGKDDALAYYMPALWINHDPNVYA